MVLKMLTVMGLALCAMVNSHAISEQKVVRFYGKLEHIGEKVPEHHEEYAWAYPAYEFSYKVDDPHTHDIKGQEESRDGDQVKGMYWLIQPDGRKRTVTYHSNKHDGFKAHVEYSDPHHEHIKHDEHKPHEKHEVKIEHAVELKHVKHEQEEHKHEEHKHEEHEHEEHKHEEHKHKEHENEEHKHKEHEDEEHKHKEHEHEEHKYEKHEHEYKPYFPQIKHKAQHENVELLKWIPHREHHLPKHVLHLDQHEHQNHHEHDHGHHHEDDHGHHHDHHEHDHEHYHNHYEQEHGHPHHVHHNVPHHVPRHEPRHISPIKAHHEPRHHKTIEYYSRY